ncbi:MAG: hypothetical protein HY908_14010 [Myxococcales bacterium]|nr:hypothetical protein [Myxococcales bacterium]
MRTSPCPQRAARSSSPVGANAQCASAAASRASSGPASSRLGASQLVVDFPNGRLVYTGDYRTGAGATHATGAPVECDGIIVESTFALPIFRFPDRARTTNALIEWCRARLDDGELPVVIAYALGKSQELVHHLIEAGLAVIAHGAVHRMCAAYESLGRNLGVADQRLRPYADEKKREKMCAVLVTPPGTQAQPMVRKRKDARIAYVSGWATIDAAIEQQRADAAFPISDHADWDDLLATIRASRARAVWVTHGDTHVLAHHLKTLGFDAVGLDAPSLDAREMRGRPEVDTSEMGQP